MKSERAGKSQGDGMKKEYKVTACLTEVEYKNLEKISKQYERTKSWIICRLISVANADLSPKIFGDDSK